MKAFWWFEENAVAGMARPGFNTIHWFDMPFDEAVIMSWLGQHSTGEIPLETFRRHLQVYTPRVLKFYGLDDRTGAEALKPFGDIAEFEKVLERAAKRSGFLREASVVGDSLKISICEDRLAFEAGFLKEHGIHHLISLTEDHHSKDFLGNHFELHHLGIPDLGAPQLEQAHAMAEIFRRAKRDKQRLAVHCLAGIGRTSTMIMAAHIVNGEDFESVKTRIAKQNPAYHLTGSQAEFIQSLVQK